LIVTFAAKVDEFATEREIARVAPRVVAPAYIVEVDNMEATFAYAVVKVPDESAEP
jgi:hypothetical protein